VLRGGGGCDDAPAHQPGDLHRRHAGAAGRAEDQHRLARLQCGPVPQGVQHGAIGVGEGGGGDRIDVVRQGHDILDGRAGQLGEAAMAGHGQNARAGGGAGHALAQRGNGAGHLAPGGEGEGRLRLVLALDDQRVGEIHRCRFDADQHLARARPRRRGLADHQGRGRAEFTAQNGSHAHFLRFARRLAGPAPPGKHRLPRRAR
jgi:hypothetical protein